MRTIDVDDDAGTLAAFSTLRPGEDLALMRNGVAFAIVRGVAPSPGTPAEGGAKRWLSRLPEEVRAALEAGRIDEAVLKARGRGALTGKFKTPEEFDRLMEEDSVDTFGVR